MLTLILSCSLVISTDDSSFAQSSNLVVQTVPSIQGIHFRVGEETFISDEHGIAVVAPTTAGAQTLEVDEHLLIDKSQRVEFAAWSDGILNPSRALDLDSSGLQVGFNIDYLVKERFHSSSGELIDPSSIDSYTIVDDNNNSTTFEGSSTGLAGPTALVWQRFLPGTRWLRAVRLVRTDGALETERVSYTVRWVTFDGQRVAGSSEPFFPTGGAEWPITAEASASPMGGLAMGVAALLLLLAGFFVLMRLRADDRTVVAHDPAPSRPLIRGRNARRQAQARIYIRVKLRNGRTVEGWKMRVPGVADSEAIYINATHVWGSDGEQVTPGPLDSFVLPSQILNLETREDLPQVLS